MSDEPREAVNWGGYLWHAIDVELGLARCAADIVLANYGKDDGVWLKRIGVADIHRMARWVHR